MIAKNILIKTILLGLIFSLISFNNLIAKSRYWSTKKVVSTNQLEIIKFSKTGNNQFSNTKNN